MDMPVGSSSFEGPLPTDPENLANLVFKTYSLRLLRLASEQLAKDIQCKVSAEDVVQSAMKSFFRQLGLLGPEITDPDAIWGLLSIITIRKCRKWEAFFRCSKRDIRREVTSLNDSTATPSRHQASVEPDHEEGLVATELLEQLLCHFTERQQQMILMRIQGVPVDVIADQCHSSLRTVARTIAKAKTLLSGILLDGS